MELTTTEKIRLIMSRQKMSMGELAEKTGQTRQNLSNKMGRNNFTEKDIRAMGEALNCKVEIIFTTADDISY